MKVLFCNPPALDGVAFVREGRCEHRASAFRYLMAPISLASAAALTRARGHEVSLIDSVADRIGLAGLLERIAAEAPGLVVFATTTATFDGDAAVAHAARDVTDAHLTAIGVHVSALPGESLEASDLDSVVRGEPEQTVAALADALSNREDLARVDGLSYRSPDGPPRHNADRPFIGDLDALPFPARDLLHNERYVAPLSEVPQTPVIPLRGCPWDCAFCTAGCYYGHRLRLRSPANVVDEMRDCVERHGVGEIWMWADTFTADRDFTLAICREIARRGLALRWICNARVDTVDVELLEAMRGAGCWAVAFGVESGSQAILDRSGKGTTLEQARRAIRIARQAGLVTMAHVVVGLPGETPRTIRETDTFIRQIDPDFVQAYCAVPFPGCRLYDEARTAGWLASRDWGAFEQSRAVMATPELTARALAAARRRILRSFYVHPRRAARAIAIVRRAGGGGLVRHVLGFAREWIRVGERGGASRQ